MIFLQVVQLTNYPIYAYLTTKLTASAQDKATHLRKSFFIEDDTEKYDDSTASNQGFVKRKSFFGNIVPAVPGDPSQSISAVPAHWEYDTQEHVFCGLLKTPLPNINFLPSRFHFFSDLRLFLKHIFSCFSSVQYYRGLGSQQK